MARGLLMLSPLLSLLLMPSMVITVMDSPIMGTVMVWLIMVTMVMPILMLMDTTMERGLLMLSPLLTHSTDITTDMLHTPGVTTATRTAIMPMDTDTDTITKLLLFCS